MHFSIVPVEVPQTIYWMTQPLHHPLLMTQTLSLGLVMPVPLLSTESSSKALRSAVVTATAVQAAGETEEREQ